MKPCHTILTVIACLCTTTTFALECTSDGIPYCENSDSDPDGDGWGWENDASCLIRADADATNTVESLVTELIDETADKMVEFLVCSNPASDPDGDGWGWENERSCRVLESDTQVIPADVAHPECQSADSDPDGDGWGWEDQQSCWVSLSAEMSATGSVPFCTDNGASDSDGDGWGWQNNRSCVVP